MTKQEHPIPKLSQETVAALIQTALRERKRGNLAEARILLHALVKHDPHEPRIWLALVAVAETRDEQREALERVLALDPHNMQVLRSLARFQTPDRPLHPTTQAGARVGRAADVPALETEGWEESTSTFEPARATTLERAAEEPEREIRWPLYVILGIAIAAVLLTAIILWRPGSTAQMQPSPPLPGASRPTPPLKNSKASSLPTAAIHAVAPTARPKQASTTVAIQIATPGQARPATPSSVSTPSIVPTVRVARTAQPTLLVGDMIHRGIWNAGLLRSEDAVVLDGSIGPLQPKGHFVLTLVTVNNTSSTPTRIPGDLFTLTDRDGNRYTPLPNASTIYLQTYGPTQRGDLSMEDPIPQGGGNVSVPLIFDVPEGVHNLRLHVGNARTGWPIDEVVAATSAAGSPSASPVNTNPTPTNEASSTSAPVPAGP